MSALATYLYGMERDKFTIYLHPTILSKILQTPLQLELHSISNLQHMIWIRLHSTLALHVLLCLE